MDFSLIAKVVGRGSHILIIVRIEIRSEEGGMTGLKRIKNGGSIIGMNGRNRNITLNQDSELCVA